MAKITSKPVSYTRLAVRVGGTPDGTYCIPVIDPKITYESTEIKYDILQDSRYAAAIKRNLIYRKLTHKCPFYMPYTGQGSAGYNALIAFYDKLLLPAGMVKTEYNNGFAYAFSEDWSAYSTANINYQELTEIESITGAYNNFKLDFSTASGMLIDVEWTGVDGGVADGITTYATATEPGLKPVFEYANLYIWKYGDAKPSYYLPCKQYTFDAGNAPDMFDDCNGQYGIGGFFMANRYDNQKVSFDVQMPKLNGSVIDANCFPYHTWFKAGELLEYEMTFPYVSIEAGNVQVSVKGVFQLSDAPDRSEDKQLRRIKLGGLCQKTSTRNGIDIIFDQAENG
jgi:hypothetical protein